MLIEKKLYYFVICLILFGCSSNEDKFVRSTNYDTGELKSTSEYNSEKDTLENGNYIGYYKTGRIRTEGFFKNGIEEGRFSKYYENTGDLEFYIAYKNGMKHGLSKWFYNNSGKLKTEKTYYFDKIDGVRKSYYENGLISDSSYYINGLRQGNRILYHENKEFKMYLFYDKQGVMTYKRVYSSEGVFKKHFGLYFTDFLVNKDIYHLGDTFSAEFFIAIPIELDYKLYYYEKGDVYNKDSDKKRIYLDNNSFELERIIDDSEIVNICFELVLDTKNKKDRSRETLEIIITPDGITPLKGKRDSLAEREVRRQVDG